MRVTYVSHACLLIDTGTSLIATDPWLDGPAFCGQWNVFPRPVNTADVEKASIVLVSHAHEDHLHEPTLKRLCHQPKKLFYPFYWYRETIDWLRGLGLGEITEARSGRTYAIDEKTNVTFIGAPGQNSIIVIDSDGQVLVNINDALHSEPNFLIDLYVDQIRRRWPEIDMVFCGFGGASYYPNVLHSENKDDRAIAKLREQLFIHKFCRIVRGLSPRAAVPFAADFVLLAPHQRWINEVRFPRATIPAYFKEHFGDGDGRTAVYAMYPGDQLVDGILHPDSPYRAHLKNGRLDHLIAEQYPQEISAFQAADVSDLPAEQWASRLAEHLDGQAKFHPRSSLKGLDFGLRFRDAAADQWFDIRWIGSRFEVKVIDTPSPAWKTKIETTSAVLETSIENDWGGDAVTVGYACDINVLDYTSAGKARVCVSLLTRYPRPSAYAIRHPLRTSDYLYQSAPMVLSRLKNTIRSHVQRGTEAEVITSPHWLTGNIEAIRRECSLPALELSE